MNDAAVLERRYRWLLRCYPRWFRDDIEDEVLGVLMAGARDGKRWPSVAEAADVVGSALRMRFRLPRPGTESRGWTDAWAVFSVLVPVFVLLTNIVVVLVPPSFLGSGSWPQQDSWLSVLNPAQGGPYGSVHQFYAALVCEAILAVLVLAGWRWASLVVLVVFAALWAASQHTLFPPPNSLINSGAGILELAALAASPGPRRGRSLLNWGHGVVLVLVIAAVKLSTMTLLVLSPFVHRPQLAWVLLLSAGALVVIAGAAAMRLRLGQHMLWIGAALLYPYLIMITSIAFGTPMHFDYRGTWSNLLGLRVTQLHLVALLLDPAVMAVLAVLIAARGRLASSRARLTPGT